MRILTTGKIMKSLIFKSTSVGCLVDQNLHILTIIYTRQPILKTQQDVILKAWWNKRWEDDNPWVQTRYCSTFNFQLPAIITNAVKSFIFEGGYILWISWFTFNHEIKSHQTIILARVFINLKCKIHQNCLFYQNHKIVSHQN